MMLENRDMMSLLLLVGEGLECAELYYNLLEKLYFCISNF